MARTKHTARKSTKPKKAEHATHETNQSRDILRTTNAPLVQSPIRARDEPLKPITDLLTEATDLLEQSQPDLALPIVEEALRRLEEERQGRNHKLSSDGDVTIPPVAVLAGETHLLLGNAKAAQSHFKKATLLDPDGLIVSADPWLWLAQLSDAGGKESIACCTHATDILRREIGALDSLEADKDEVEFLRDEKHNKLAEALCSMAEVYMTDLSWEPDAEERCERYVTEAMTIIPQDKSAGTLQCLANVRISQGRVDEAKDALRESLRVWKEDEDNMPDFAGRVSLCRLLMEVAMLAEATVVLDGLTTENDQSVEAWYLGGWCQVLRAADLTEGTEEKTKALEGARTWLKSCLRLYDLQEYEDERLQAHARELLQDLAGVLGSDEGEGEEEEEQDDWQEMDSEDGIEVEDDGEDDVGHHQALNGDVEMT